MNDLNNVPKTGTFGSSVDVINGNFELVETAISQLESRTSKFAGFFQDAAALEADIPSPTVGMWADVGSTKVIYRCETTGTWTNTEETDTISTSVSYDTVDNLTSTSTTRPLSAKQGKVLNDTITSLKEAGYVFVGVTSPSASITTPSEKVYYIAPSGTYTNFGSSYTVSMGNVGIFSYNGSWSFSTFNTSLFPDLQDEILATYIALMFKSRLTAKVPDSTQTGFFKSNGELSSNSSYTINKYSVTPNKIYTFSGDHAASVTIPFIAWADSNGDFIRVENYMTSYGGLSYTDRGVVAPQGAAYAWLNVQNSKASYYNFKELGLPDEVMTIRGTLSSCDLNDVTSSGMWLLTSSNSYQNAPYSVGFLRVSVLGTWVLQEFFYFNGWRLLKRKFQIDNPTIEDWGEIPSGLSDIQAAVYNSIALTPSSVVTGSLFSSSGSVSTNANYSIKKYAVSEGELYSFNGYHSSSETIPFVGWADANDNWIDKANTEVSDVTYVNKGVVAPHGAAYAWLNVRVSNEEMFGFGIVDIGKSEPSMKMKGTLPSCNVKDVTETGTWLLGGSNTYTGTPTGSNYGFLRVSRVSGLRVLQEIFDWNGGGYYKRRDGESDWQTVGGGGGGSITNEYTFNEYQQTVNLTATPTITTDTNNYLASTGDTTDRTADILAMLQSTGVCHLGAGVFYVDSLIMPDNTSLIGSGIATQVYLIDGTNKFTIRMGSQCVVKDMKLLGGQSNPSFDSVGTRTGILWQGNYTQTESSSGQPQYGTIDNVHITRFDNSGIRCYDTGYGTSNFLSVTNCHIYHCWFGVNIEYWSEFHKFTNVRCAYCQYGCVNNGGNNVFVNCDFSSSRYIAFMIDNSQGQSPNDAHGSCVGCVFNHTANNAGVGIKIDGSNNGFVFDGCQIFFSQIAITDSSGITFSSCNFGNVNCSISVTNGGAMLFANNMHQAAPTIAIVNNSNVHFVNCYVRSTGAEVTPN